MRGFCRPYRACWWRRVIPGLRHAQARALPRAMFFRPCGAPATEEGPVTP